MEKQQAESASKKSTSLGSSMQECIQNCLDCFTVCEETLARCFVGSTHKDSSHLILLKSCAEICNTSAKFMLMNSPLHPETCGVCAKVCQACADSCQSLGDSSMQECIDACRKCADSCNEMSKMSH